MKKKKSKRGAKSLWPNEKVVFMSFKGPESLKKKIGQKVSSLKRKGYTEINASEIMRAVLEENIGHVEDLF